MVGTPLVQQTNTKLATWPGGTKQLNPQYSSPGSGLVGSSCVGPITSGLESVWLGGDAICSRACAARICSSTCNARSRALPAVKYFIGTRMAMIAIRASATTATFLQNRSGRWVGADRTGGLAIRAVGAALPEIVSTAVFTWLICW